MRLRIDRDQLAEAVSWTARSLPSRPTVPVLGGVLVEAGGQLRLSTFDYEVCAQASIDATVDEPGTVLIPGRLLVEIVRGLPPESVDLRTAGAHVAIDCGGFHYSVLTMPVDDYPALPPMPPLVASLGVDSFVAAVGQVTVAAGRDQTLPLLTAIRLADAGGQLSLGCTDRYRMAVRRIPWRRVGSGGAVRAPGAVDVPGPAEGAVGGVGPVAGVAGSVVGGVGPVAGVAGSVVGGVGPVGGGVGPGEGVPAAMPVALVPARVLAEAAKALGSGRARVSAEVHLGLDDSTLGVECGGRRLISRLVDVRAPDYDARVPHAGPWRAEVDTATLIEAVKRVSLVAAPLSPLRLAFTAGEVRLEAATGEEAKAAATLSATLHGEEITVAVKPQFLVDGLAALDSDLATLTFTDPRQPVLLTGKPDGEPESEFRYLTMPLRL